MDRKINTHKVPQYFIVAATLWGILAILLGGLTTAQLLRPELNNQALSILGLNQWGSFGRLQALHTYLLLFAFGGSTVFATSYYMVQKTSNRPLAFSPLAHLSFWGWQALLVINSLTIVFDNYIKLELLLDILLALTWSSYAISIFSTFIQKNAPRIHFSNWIIGLFIIFIAFLIIKALISKSLHPYQLDGYIHSHLIYWSTLACIFCLYSIIPNTFGHNQIFSKILNKATYSCFIFGIFLYVSSTWLSTKIQDYLLFEQNYTFLESSALTRFLLFFCLLGFFIQLLGMLMLLSNVICTATLNKPTENQSIGTQIENQHISFVLFSLLAALSLGGLPQMESFIFNKPHKKYTFIELAGHGIYIREGCGSCHLQTTQSDLAPRNYYRSSQTPFWKTSFRVGQDLGHIGKIYSDEWLRHYLVDPLTIIPDSKMPAYTWLADEYIDGRNLSQQMQILRTQGVDYTEKDIAEAEQLAKHLIARDALIAYLQSIDQ